MHHNEWDIDVNRVEETAEEGNSSLPMEVGFLSKGWALVCDIRHFYSLTHPQTRSCQLLLLSYGLK